MCIICIDFDRRAMSLSEARRAFGEMRGELAGHADEVEAKLAEAEGAPDSAPAVPYGPAPAPKATLLP